MGSLRSRIVTFILSALFALLLAAGAASAAITSSTITTPGNGAELYYDGDSGAGSVNVRGSVSSPSPGARGDILCYTLSDTHSTKVASGLDVSSGSFSASISLAPVAGEACRLALVPQGTTPSGSAAAAFAGPAISVSERFSHSSNGNLWGYYVLSGTLPFSFAFQSLGDCPVATSYATDPATLGSFSVFAGNNCLPKRSGIGAANGNRSALQVDGSNAFLPAAISNLTGIAGFQPLAYSAAFDAAHDTVTITEEEVPTVCDPPGGFPPTPGNCPSLHDSGLVIDQTTTLLGGGQVTRVHERVRSVDGKAHALDLLFGQSVGDPAGGPVPGFLFPGQSSIATHASPDSFTGFAAGPGTIVVDRDASAAPSTANPTGGITYNRPPTSADFVSAQGSNIGTFLMHYADQVPAGAANNYEWSFTQSASGPQLASLDAIERDRFYTPGITITRPHRRRSVTHTFAPLLSGRVSDPVGISSLRVANKLVSVARDGGFAVRLNLRHRRNAITVTVTNLGGVASTIKLKLIYKPRACVVPKLRGLSLARAQARLLSRDCRVRVRFVRSRRVRKGHVVRARPAAGGSHRPRTRVSLLVSRGR